MANHGKPLPPEAPRVKWGSIIRSDRGYALATMVTQNGKQLEQHLGDPTSRDEAEDQFRIWAGRELMGWGEE